MTAESEKVIKSFHDFKKAFFPISYKRELEEELTSEEMVELLVRRSIKQTTNDVASMSPPKSIRVANIEDVEKELSK